MSGNNPSLYFYCLYVYVPNKKAHCVDHSSLVTGHLSNLGQNTNFQFSCEISRRRITLSSCFGHMPKFHPPDCTTTSEKGPLVSVLISSIQCFIFLCSNTWHMLVTMLQIAYHSCAFPHSSRSYDFYSWKTDIFRLFPLSIAFLENWIFLFSNFTLLDLDFNYSSRLRSRLIFPQILSSFRIRF